MRLRLPLEFIDSQVRFHTSVNELRLMVVLQEQRQQILNFSEPFEGQGSAPGTEAELAEACFALL